MTALKCMNKHRGKLEMVSNFITSLSELEAIFRDENFSFQDNLNICSKKKKKKHTGSRRDCTLNLKSGTGCH